MEKEEKNGGRRKREGGEGNGGGREEEKRRMGKKKERKKREVKKEGGTQKEEEEEQEKEEEEEAVVCQHTDQSTIHSEAREEAARLERMDDGHVSLSSDQHQQQDRHRHAELLKEVIELAQKRAHLKTKS